MHSHADEAIYCERCKEIKLTDKEIHLAEKARPKKYLCFFCRYKNWETASGVVGIEMAGPEPKPEDFDRAPSEIEEYKKKHLRSNLEQLLEQHQSGGTTAEDVATDEVVKKSDADSIIPHSVMRATSDGQFVVDPTGMAWDAREREEFITEHGWDPGLHPTRLTKMKVTGTNPGNFLEISIAAPMTEQQKKAVLDTLQMTWSQIISFLAYGNIDYNVVIKATQTKEGPGF